MKKQMDFQEHPEVSVTLRHRMIEFGRNLESIVYLLPGPLVVELAR